MCYVCVSLSVCSVIQLARSGLTGGVYVCVCERTERLEQCQSQADDEWR